MIPLKHASAQNVADAFLNHYILKYGAPLRVISDNGPQFVSSIFSQLCRTLDIAHFKICPYRPQSNMAERANRNIVMMIRSFLSLNHQSWEKHLEQLAFALRTAKNDTTQFTPAELFLGRKIITPLDKLFFVANRTSEFKLHDMESILRQANINIEKGRATYSKYYNLRRRSHTFKPGQKILKATHPLSSAPDRYTAKFSPKFEGPYTITEVKDNNLIIENDQESLTINVDQARPYTERTDIAAQKERKRNTPPQRTSEDAEPQPSTSTGGFTSSKISQSTRKSNTRTSKRTGSRKGTQPYNTPSHTASPRREHITPTSDASHHGPNSTDDRNITDNTTVVPSVRRPKRGTSKPSRQQIRKPQMKHQPQPRKTPKAVPQKKPADTRAATQTTRSILKRPGNNNNGRPPKQVKFFLKRSAQQVPLPHYRRRKLRDPNTRDYPETHSPRRRSSPRRKTSTVSYAPPVVPAKRQFSNGNGSSHKQFKHDNKRKFGEVWSQNYVPDSNKRHRLQKLRFLPASIPPVEAETQREPRKTPDPPINWRAEMKDDHRPNPRHRTPDRTRMVPHRR